MTKKINVPMWDQMQVFCKRIADHQIRMVLYFDELLNEKILNEAVRSTVENNPIVCANYDEEHKRPLWKFADIDMDKIYSYNQCNEPEPLLKETLLEQIDTFTGYQVKISLIRSGKDILILNCNHAVTDAAGVKNFMYQIAENYSKILQKKTVTRQNYVPLRSLKLLSEKLSLKEKLSVLKLTLSNKNAAPTFQKQYEIRNVDNPDFEMYTVSPGEFEKIKEFGKKHSATVNDMLLTLFYYTLKKVLGNSNKTNRLTYSSDIRAYMNGLNYDALSNYSAIHNIDIDNSINEFVSLLKEISRITTVRKQMKYSLADFPMMAVLFKSLPYKKLKGLFHKQFDKIREDKLAASPSLSNTGIIEETKVNFDSIAPSKAYMLGGINHPGLFQLIASTYKKHLSLSIGSFYSGENKAFITNFIEEFKMTINMEVIKTVGNK